MPTLKGTTKPTLEEAKGRVARVKITVDQIFNRDLQALDSALGEVWRYVDSEGNPVSADTKGAVRDQTRTVEFFTELGTEAAAMFSDSDRIVTMLSGTDATETLSILIKYGLWDSDTNQRIIAGTINPDGSFIYNPLLDPHAA